MNIAKRILIISSAETEYAVGINDAFVTGLHEHLGTDIDIEWHNYTNIRIEFATDCLEVTVQSSGQSLADFDFVYFKSFFRFSEQAAVISTYLDAHNIPFVCSELRDHMSLSKLTQFARLAYAGIPIAQTVYLNRSRFLNEFDYLCEKLGDKFIFKSIDGSGGRENYLITEKTQLEAALAENPELEFVAQRFIPNDNDLRVLILGKEIRLIIMRQRAGESHMNNTSQGGAASILPLGTLSPEHQALTLKAAAVLRRETAGVDLMFETGTLKPYILEVNASPQIGSGAFTEEKLEIYCKYFENVLK